MPPPTSDPIAAIEAQLQTAHFFPKSALLHRLMRKRRAKSIKSEEIVTAQGLQML